MSRQRVRTNQFTPYNWISDDHGKFDTYTSLHPEAKTKHVTDLGGAWRTEAPGGGYLYDPYWGSPMGNTRDWDVVDHQFKYYTTEDAAPTSEQIVMGLGATYDEYLFQRARREHPEYYDDDLQLWQPHHKKNVIGATFESPTQMTDYIYNNPETDWRYNKVLAGISEGLWNYETQEAEYDTEAFEREVSQFMETKLPEALRTEFNESFSRMFMKAAEYYNQRINAGPGAYRYAVRVARDNLQALEDGIDNYGLEGEEITNLVNAVADQDTPALIRLPIEWEEEKTQAGLVEWEEEKGMSLTDFTQARGEYARNILRQDIYKELEANPNADFETVMRTVRPNEVPQNYLNYYQDMYDEAQTALANGEDLTLQIYMPPERTAVGQGIYGYDSPYTLDTVEVEAGTRRQRGVDLGDAGEEKFEDPMNLPEGEDRADQVFDGYDDPIEFRIVEDYELRTAAERALVESGEYQYIEAANLATEDMIDAAFGGAGAGLLMMSFTPQYGSILDWFNTGPGVKPTDFAAALPGAANVSEQIAANQRREEEAQLQAERDEIAARIKPMEGKNCFVRIRGQWYRGTVGDTTILQNYRGITANVAAVNITYRTVGGRTGQQSMVVPLDDDTLFRIDDGTWRPDQVAFWEPGSDPTEQFYTNNTHIEDHLREQIYADGRWRTLKTVRPAPGYPNNKTLVFEDGTTFVLKGIRNVPVRLFGDTQPQGTDPETDDGETKTEERDDEETETDDEETDFDENVIAAMVDENRPPDLTNPITKKQGDIRKNEYVDDQGIMSYLLREHNEIYTIWKNPDYTGTDPNRVERIFGGVVPFLSYNSEGHPILMNDQSLNHHGHTEFNMVHVSNIELQEQNTGTISPDDTAAATTETNPETQGIT